MSGSSTTNTFGVYGLQGTPAPGNSPGSRFQAVTWTDSNGNLWLFGGDGSGSSGYSGFLNDLWEFNPSSSQWTWINGSATLPTLGVADGQYGALGTPAAGNIPPGRAGAVSWTDAKGNLWLFGGGNYTRSGIFSFFNDLWQFSPSTGMWTWMGGSSSTNQSGVYGTLGTAAAGNIPGARENAVGIWDGKGNFWLYSGNGYDSAGAQNSLGDLWTFNQSTGLWTWISGPKIAGQGPVTGTEHQAAAGNIPGARNSAVGWMDLAGNLWIGFGTGCNDLWEFNPTTSEWAWMSGTPVQPFPSTVPGVYGTLQTPAATNVPGDRSNSASWTDAAGNFWLFGGYGFDETNTVSFLNDLWEYSPSLGEWAWMGGDSTVPQTCASIYSLCGQPGEYGTLQISSFLNFPGGRYNAASWTDSKGNFWLFGGVGADRNHAEGPLNDLWQFQPNTNSSSITATPIISPGSGTYASTEMVTIVDSTPGATISYAINGSKPVLQYSGPIAVSSSETIQAIASAPGYANSNLATATYVDNLPQAAAPSFSIAPGTYSTPQTVTISDTTPWATIYYAIGAVPTTSSTVYSGPITVSAPETVEAIAVANDYANSLVATVAYNIGSNPSAQWTWMGGSSAISGICPASAICAPSGSFGKLETFAATNLPPARAGSVSWTDSNGNFWVYGGETALGTGNDLWEYKPSIAQWAWMSGSSNIGQDFPGVYGTMGVAAANNTPGNIQNAVGWADTHGNLWLYGGSKEIAIQSNGTGQWIPLNDLWKFDTTVKEWVWMGGDSSLYCIGVGECYSATPVFGTFGIPAATNSPGGLSAATAWTDQNGNFWLYGGFGRDSRGNEWYPNVLWEYNPNTNQWAWMGGSNVATYFDAGEEGIFGAIGVPQAGTYPWSLQSAMAWTDKTGNFWLFGGSATDPLQVHYLMNDMWQYFPALGEWAYMSANGISNGNAGTAAYGTEGNWSAANIPGAREYSSSWTDSDGNFWMFGGDYALNDLWEFKPGINQWAWLGGSNAADQSGVYGTLGITAPGNIPGARQNGAAFTDRSGNLWLFGGLGFDSEGNAGPLNDLWQFSLKSAPTVAPAQPAATPTFSPAAGSYALAQTVTISDQTAGATVYYTDDGTTPTSASKVYTGALSVASSETLQAIAVASNTTFSAVASAAYTITGPKAATPTFSVAGGLYTVPQTVTISDATPSATIYYTTDGSTPSSNSKVYSAAITVSASETIQAIAVANGYNTSAVASVTYTINQPPTFTVAASPTSLTTFPGGQGTVTVTVAGQNGFNSAVTLDCSGLPLGATCSFSPASVTPGVNSVTSKLTISVAAQSGELRQNPQPFLPPFLPPTALAALVWLSARNKRRVLRLLMLTATLTGLGLTLGCGGGSTGGGGGSGSTPVTSTVTITATSGTMQQTTNLSLTVN